MYTLGEVATAIGADIELTQSGHEIAYLLTDSRRVIAPTISLFFALKGHNHDGHRFIPELYARGVRCFVVEKGKTLHEPDACILRVENVLSALQTLATWHRSHFEIPVIGITGSNGKTIVKEWLYALLQKNGSVLRSPRSYNSQIGVPLSVWQLRPEHTLAIFEAGISQRGEMQRLQPIIRCDIGIFTMLGDAHREGFADNAEKLQEKLKLFAETPIVIYCADDPLVHQQMQMLPILPNGKERRLLTWARNSGASLRIISQKQANEHTIISGRWQGQPTRIEVPFVDAASVHNACICWLVMLYLEQPPQAIAERMLQLEPVAMRLELKAGINNCQIINDSYNYDIEGLRTALDFMVQQGSQLARTVILSDMPHAAPAEKEFLQLIDSQLLARKVTKLICIGKRLKSMELRIKDKISSHFYDDTNEFLTSVLPTDFRDEVILIKGARDFGFERIAHRLSRKAHKTVLEINLNALAHNLSVFRARLRPGVRLLAMVKASAYGNGSAEVAHLLAFHGVEYLSVAYADEGIELRQQGIRLPILVLNPDAESFEAMRRYALEPEIYSLSLLRDYLQDARPDDPGIHLKLDTGMRRLGFEQADIPELCRQLTDKGFVRVKSIFSHLAGSEAAEHDAFTAVQVASFEAMSEQISDALDYRPLRHILNSGGIVRHPNAQFDLVRLGIGLYGIDSSDELQQLLEPVQTLKATISQIKHLAKGETIGYSRRGVADRDSRTATISIGYADGLHRLAGNGRYEVQVHGQQAPIIGNVCMDMTMIDVTDIPLAAEGDEVIVFGPGQPIQRLANVMQTIPYEVLTGISGRVHRVYYQE